MRARPDLRTRATLLGTAAFAVLLTVGSVVLVTVLESHLTSASDRVARSRVEDLLALTRGDGDIPRTLLDVGDEGLVQVLGPRDDVRASSPALEGRPAVADLPADPTPQEATLPVRDGGETESYRVWYASARGEDGGPVTVYVGSSLESVAEASGALRRALWVGVPVAVLLLGGVMWLLIGRALARLDRIRAEVDRITEESLDTRVAGEGVDDEVGRLAATMNAMLGRLDAAARRQRDFVADVSHDLQSPLTAQRVALELALADPLRVDAGRLRTDVLGATADMERLVHDLLVLASVDAGTVAAPVLTDLDVLVLEEVTRARTASAVALDVSGVSAAPAYANPDDLRRIVRNLLDNATRYAATRVEARVDVVHGWAQLDVVDDGPGVPAEHRERVFDRFHRGDPARSRRGGTGLGLTVARSLAERSGGALDLVPGHGGGPGDGPVDEPGGAHLRLRVPTGPHRHGSPAAPAPATVGRPGPHAGPPEAARR